MNKKNFLFVFCLILIGLWLVLLSGGVQAQPRLGGTPGPIITHSYAIEKGRYGDVLKIYIAAEDQNGDMLKVATSVQQVGYGRHSTDWIYLKKEYQSRFVGYLQWNTYSSKYTSMMEWAYINITVSVFDKAGNESNFVVFPFEFISEVISNPPPPAPFDKANIPMLGHVHIDLYNPAQDQGDGNVVR